MSLYNVYAFQWEMGNGVKNPLFAFSSDLEFANICKAESMQFQLHLPDTEMDDYF